MSQILLVEDDPLAQEIVSSILESQGFKVDIASDGFTALRMLRETPYEIALVDYHLPEMDGFALARLMRDIDKGREVPLHLVGVTADRHGLAARRGVDGIFDAILAKPFDPHELIMLLKRGSGADVERDEAAKAAALLLADPDFDQARLAAASFWRTRGVHGLPKVAILPKPTADQIGAVQMCFDVVDRAAAELLLLLDARGLQELVRSRLDGAVAALPVVTLDRSLVAVCDASFTVADPASWSEIACLVKDRRAKSC